MSPQLSLIFHQTAKPRWTGAEEPGAPPKTRKGKFCNVLMSRMRPATPVCACLEYCALALPGFPYKVLTHTKC
eukprot:1911440-Amphidinium_carterae.1